jgi:DNA-binding MarR family transcriptional regulator
MNKSAVKTKSAKVTQASAYLQAIHFVERLQPALEDVVREALSENNLTAGISPPQALMMFHMGDREFSAGQLREKKVYFGSNVTFNLKKLVEKGLATNVRNPKDRRSATIRLTDDGIKIAGIVGEIFAEQEDIISGESGIPAADIRRFVQVAQRLERFWVNSVRFGEYA